MSLGPVVDGAIGLILIYVMLSLLVTTITELISSVLNLRGERLIAAVGELTKGLPSIAGSSALGGGAATIERVIDHPLIASPAARRRAAYVDTANFTAAVLDHLGASDAATDIAQLKAAVNGVTDQKVRHILLNLLARSGGDMVQLRGLISHWFDTAMDGVSGQYKRLSQYIALALGLIVAIALNASTLNIVQTLWTDSNTRAAMVRTAASQPAPQIAVGLDVIGVEKSLRAARLAESPLPLGWSAEDISVRLGSPAFWLRALGWAMTGLALSLGAPFWFDLLQRLVNFRNTGPKPGAPQKR